MGRKPARARGRHVWRAEPTRALAGFKGQLGAGQATPPEQGQEAGRPAFGRRCSRAQDRRSDSPSQHSRMEPLEICYMFLRQ